jgi:hypothetical protein
MDATLTIAPRPRSTIPGSAAWGEQHERGHVQLELVEELRRGGSPETLAQALAGVVDQQVDRRPWVGGASGAGLGPAADLQPAHHGIALGGVGQIGRDQLDHRSAEREQALADLRQPDGVAGDEYQPVALRRQVPGEGLADAGGGPGHERGVHDGDAIGKRRQCRSVPVSAVSAGQCRQCGPAVRSERRLRDVHQRGVRGLDDRSTRGELGQHGAGEPARDRDLPGVEVQVRGAGLDSVQRGLRDQRLTQQEVADQQVADAPSAAARCADPTL